MIAGSHPEAVAGTTAEARRGRSLIERAVVRFPALLNLGARAILAAPRSRLRTALLLRSYRLATAAINRRDWEVVTLALDPDDFTFAAGDPGAMRLPDARSTYRGRDGYVELMELWVDAWGTIQAEIEDVVDVGRNRLLILFRHRAHGGASGMTIDQPVADVSEFRRGRLVRQTYWFDREAAFRSLGLQPPEARR